MDGRGGEDWALGKGVVQLPPRRSIFFGGWGRGRDREELPRVLFSEH
jgi:hypothetical protein